MTWPSEWVGAIFFQNNLTFDIFWIPTMHTSHHHNQQEKGGQVHMQLLLRRATEDSTVSFGVPTHYFEKPCLKKRSLTSPPSSRSCPVLTEITKSSWGSSTSLTMPAWPEERKSIAPHSYPPNRPELTPLEMGTTRTVPVALEPLRWALLRSHRLRLPLAWE